MCYPIMLMMCFRKTHNAHTLETLSIMRIQARLLWVLKMTIKLQQFFFDGCGPNSVKNKTHKKIK